MAPKTIMTFAGYVDEYVQSAKKDDVLASLNPDIREMLIDLASTHYLHELNFAAFVKDLTTHLGPKLGKVRRERIHGSLRELWDQCMKQNMGVIDQAPVPPSVLVRAESSMG